MRTEVFYCWACMEQISVRAISSYARWSAADNMGWRKWWGKWFCPHHAGLWLQGEEVLSLISDR
jgi:hypothetical protein